MGFYYDEAGNLNAELFDSLAHEKAKQFINDRLNSNQLRRFYNECKNIETRFKLCCQGEDPKFAQQKAFLTVLPRLKLLKSKISYAKKKIPKSFETWLTQSIDAVETPMDFKAFLLSFEAVVGFCYGEGISQN